MQVLGVEGGCFRFYRPQLVLYCQYSPSCGQYSGFWSLYWNYNCEISFDVALNRAVKSNTYACIYSYIHDCIRSRIQLPWPEVCLVGY